MAWHWIRCTSSPRRSPSAALTRLIRRVHRCAARRLGAIPGLVRTRRPGTADREIELDRQRLLPVVREFPKAHRRQPPVEPRDDLLFGAGRCRNRRRTGSLTKTCELRASSAAGGRKRNHRNLIALGTLALIADPDQQRLLINDLLLISSAVEEMLRWNSPVVHMAERQSSTSTIAARAFR